MANTLIQHHMEKFGMVTVLDARFYDVTTNKILLEFDTLKVSNISAEGQQKEIRGGQGADLLLSYDYGRTANVEITDALASMHSLQYLWGGTVDSDGFEYDARKEIEYVATANAMKVAGALKGNYTIVYKDGADNMAQRELTLAADGEITIPAYTKGTAEPEMTPTKVIVYYRTAAIAGNHVRQLTLTATDFPPVVKLVGETFLIDQSTGKKIAMQIEIPRFKISPSFTFTLEGEGDASVFDFSGVALSNSGELMKIRTIGEI